MNHVPVLIDEIANLASGCRRIVDCTVGDGGHSARLLRPETTILAIDLDPRAIKRSQAVLDANRVTWINKGYADPATIEEMRRFRPDFVLLDLGISSAQIDEDEYGFSFRTGVKLDMRMAGEGTTASDILNSFPPEELTELFREYADEKHAKRLANEITKRRSSRPFETSDDFVNAIRAALGPRTGPADFARLFQSIRIAVNGEIEALNAVLPAALDALQPNGQIAVISYHSVEDRVVKQLFREWSRECICPAGVPICTCRGTALGKASPRKPIVPSNAELASNPRARSAKLRVFRKADATQG